MHLSDSGGDKAGHDDKCCKIEARRGGREPIVVTHQEATMDQAIRGAGNLHCPKCDSTMNLAGMVRRPSGLDVSIFDCSKCDHAHIVTSALESQRDTRSLNDMAVDALEEARRMSPGMQRSEALKKAGLLHRTADNRGLISLRGGFRK